MQWSCTAKFVHGKQGGKSGWCHEKNCDFMAHHRAAGRRKACPVCGNEVAFNCWHSSTEEVQSEWMAEEKSLELQEEYKRNPYADHGIYQEGSWT